MRPFKRIRVEPEAAADPAAIRAAALTLLARREHSARELAQKLGGRGYDSAATRTVLEALGREGLLSEERFLENFISQRTARGQGPARIRLELGELGIDAGRVDQALAETEVDWCDLARRVRQKKFGTAAPRGFDERAKQARFLQYRGFTADQVRAALDE